MTNLIENKGPNNLLDVLCARMKTSTSVRFGVAFMTSSGLDRLLAPLLAVARRGDVSILTGLYQCFTEPSALKKLLKLEEQTRGRLSARISSDSRFHRKVYLYDDKHSGGVIIGSQNLTVDGLSGSGELSVEIRQTGKRSFVAKATAAFIREWKDNSSPLTADLISRYEHLWRKATPGTYLTPAQMKQIVSGSTTRRHGRRAAGRDLISYWRDGLTAYVTNKTEALVTNSTDWDKRGFLWMTTGGRHAYSLGDRVLLFDRLDSKLRNLQVRDFTEISTPDGRYFVAFSERKGNSRTMTKTFWRAAGSLGLTKKRTGKRAKLSADSYRMIAQLIRRTA